MPCKKKLMHLNIHLNSDCHLYASVAEQLKSMVVSTGGRNKRCKGDCFGRWKYTLHHTAAASHCLDLWNCFFSVCQHQRQTLVWGTETLWILCILVQYGYPNLILIPSYWCIYDGTMVCFGSMANFYSPSSQYSWEVSEQA